MAAAALIAFSGSVPATAVGLEQMPPSVVELTGRYVAAARVTDPPLQALAAASAIPGAITRDGYTVTAAPPPPPVVQVAAVSNGTGAVRWPVPVSTRVSGDYGPRIAPCAGCSTFHKGADLVPGYGTPITAIANGVVTAVSATDSGGLGVHAVIEHVIDGRTVSSVYGHMVSGSLALHVGESVAVGQLIGNVGSTGQSTGAHLHFEILLDGTTPTDPLAWLEAHAS